MKIKDYFLYVIKISTFLVLVIWKYSRLCWQLKQLKDSVCGEKWNMNSTYIHRRVRRYVGTHMLICIYRTINHTVKLSLISLNSQTEEEKDSISFHILFCQMEVCSEAAPHTTDRAQI